MSNLRLQKLLYFVQAQFLVYGPGACFSEEIEAWDFGPIVLDVYYKYALCGSGHIPYPTKRTNFEAIASADKEMIVSILELAANYSTSALVQIIHQQKPWRDAYNRWFDRTISHSSLKSFFCDTSARDT